MGQNVPIRPFSRGLTIDWMLLAVAAMAAALVAGTLIRTSTDADPTRSVGGLRVLGEGDVLVAYEDYSFGADGWTFPLSENVAPGIGGVLGRFADQRVERVFDLPPDARQVEATFDLILIDDWADAPLRFWVNGEVALVLTGSTREGAQAGIELSDLPGLDVTVFEDAPPRERGYSSNGAADMERVFTLRVLMTDPGTTLTLTFMSEQAGPIAEASWALDNLIVIAGAVSDAN